MLALIAPHPTPPKNLLSLWFSFSSFNHPVKEKEKKKKKKKKPTLPAIATVNGTLSLLSSTFIPQLLKNEEVEEEEEESGVEESIEDPSSLVGTYPFPHSLYNRKNQDVVLPRFHSVEVPHINQLYSWDCGLACVLMVLRTIGIDHCDIHDLWEICSTSSIWTVDLAYLLDKFSVSFSFFTVTVGANPDFSVETFYKEQLPNDLLRVDRLFQQALGSGINIQCRSISSEELSVLILSGSYIAIALVDQYKLSRSWLEDVCVSGLYGGNSGYTGHYVVICGYDADKDEFEIRDPARSRKFERVSLECLEEARKSFGTDEDLLLISLEKREGRKQALSVTVTR